MKKLMLVILLIMPISVKALECPQVNSRGAIVYDLKDNKIVLEKNSNDKVQVASLTKILTVMTAINNVEDINREVVVTNDMIRDVDGEAVTANLKSGDIVTYKDLLYMAILSSAADAVHVLANTTSGSIPEFIDRMNSLAKSLEMNDSNFLDAVGMDKNGQYTTLNDLVKLLKYALDNKTFREVFTAREYRTSNNKTIRPTIFWYSKNLEMDTSRILGSKTGFTDKAGLCLASLINSHDREMVVITVNAGRNKKEALHIVDTINLISYVDNKYQPIYYSKESIIVDKKDEYSIRDLRVEQVIFIIAMVFLFSVLIIPKKKR